MSSLQVSKLFRLGILLIAPAVALSSVAETYTTAEASRHVGEQATVCGKVASERTATSSRGVPTFINLDECYPNQVFTVLIWQENRPQVDPLPAQGAHICVTGLIRSFQGKPEVEVKAKSQLSH